MGVRTSIAKKPYIFMIYHGGGGGPDPLPLSGSAHVNKYILLRYHAVVKTYFRGYIHLKVSWIVVEPYSCHKATPCLGTNRE